MISTNLVLPVNPQDDGEIYKFLNKIVGQEISQLTRPCHYVKLTKYWEDLKNRLAITDSMILQFRKEISKQYQTFNIFNDKFTILLIMGMIFYARKNKMEISRMFYRLLSIKFYSNVFHRFFKFCQPEIFKTALESVSPRHLFKVKMGIGTSIIYLADVEFDKNQKILSNNLITDEQMVKFVYMLRTRIFQSVRSFAEIYYQLEKDIKLTKVEEDEESRGVQLIADKISMVMCTFGNVDKIALSKSITQSNIRKDLAITVISEISSNEYKDKIKFIIILMGRIFELKNVCIELERLKAIRKMMSLNKIGGKYILKDQILDLLYSTQSGYQLKKLNEHQVLNLFNHYLTIFMQNRIC